MLETWVIAAVAVILGIAAVGLSLFGCLQRGPSSHRQLDDIVLSPKMVVEEISDDLKALRLKEIRQHWDTSDGIIIKDLPRLGKKLSVSEEGVVLLRQGKIISEAVQQDINTSEAVGNILWQLSTYGHRLATATDVALVNAPERSQYMSKNEEEMIQLVRSHDLHSFPLRLARAINQQVIAPAFAFLYAVVDVPAGKPFLDSRGPKSWTVEIELPGIADPEAAKLFAAQPRMSAVELITREDSAGAKANCVVIRHLRQSRCCLPPTSPNFFLLRLDYRAPFKRRRVGVTRVHHHRERGVLRERLR